MNKSLDEFVRELSNDLHEFEKEYLKKSIDTPKLYPLVLDGGLWFAFFSMYRQAGKP